MGYELWTSPITGYRRKGTRLSELRSILDVGVKAREILEPLLCCPAAAPAAEMKRILQKRGFDVAGVMENAGGPVTGYVVAEDLEGQRISDHAKALCSEVLISESTPLAEVLGSLRTREHVFVVVSTGVKGIVTRADLNKPLTRIYLFALVSLLEMHLRFWVRTTYKGDSWQTHLAEKRLDAAKHLQDERRARNDQISLLDCLQFCDLRDLAVRVQEIRTKLDFVSKNKGTELLENAEELRNRLAHSQQDLVEGTSWPELIGVIEKVEKTVKLSDDAVEEQARKSEGDDTLLWVAG